MELADATLRPGDDPFIGSVIAGFQIVKKIGEGAMGIVYMAKQVSLDRFIALKILPPNPVFLQGDTIGRFMREARMAASLSHVNIVQVHDAGEHEGLYFIAMEYVRGLGLSEILKSLQRLTERAALEICLQTAQGLGAGADRGVIHRDIKPANLMVTEDVVVKVADFGLAKALEPGAAGLTEPGKILGTPSYMSPEQADSKPVDLRSDIFSLGVTLFESVTGSKPFQGDSIAAVLRQVVEAPTPDVREFREDLSDETVGIIKRMLEKNLVDRYQNYPELIQDLLMAKRSLPSKEGYLDSVKTLIHNEMAEREMAKPPTIPEVKSSVATIKLGPATMGKAAPMEKVATMPPFDPADPARRASGARRSLKPLFLGAGGGMILLAAALLAVFLAWKRGGPNEPIPPPGPTPTFTLEITRPADGAVFPPGELKVEGNFSGKTPKRILIQGKPAWVSEGKFGASIELKEGGKISLNLVAEGENGFREKRTLSIFVDDRPPALKFGKRIQGGKFITRTDVFAISGHLVDDHPAEVTVDGVPVPLLSRGKFRYTGKIESEGSRDIVFEGRDLADHAVRKTVEVIRDSTAPEIRIAGIPSAVISVLPECRFQVYADEALSKIFVNNVEMYSPREGPGYHSVRAALKGGNNTIIVTAVDLAGNKSSKVKEVLFRDLRTEEGKEHAEKVIRELREALTGKSLRDRLPLLEKFLKEFPESAHAPGIRKKIERLSTEAERASWTDVVDAASGSLDDKIAALLSYLEQFENGRHAEKAKHDLEFFRRLKGEPAELRRGSLPGMWVNPADGAEIVRVPQGTYNLFGKPQRRVWIGAFLIYKNEVTAEQFAGFLTAVHSSRDENGNPLIASASQVGLNAIRMNVRKKGKEWTAVEGFENHPAVYVTWFGAAAYARWTGGALPTEAQWETAAIGAPTSPKAYFWGETMKTGYAWYLGNSDGSPKPVGTRQANFLGLNDISGNVWEWCRDYFDPDFPKTAAARRRDPFNLTPSPLRALRGGAWNSPAHLLRLRVRTGVNPGHSGPSIGFRVVIPQGR